MNLDAEIAGRVMGWQLNPRGVVHGKTQEVYIDDNGLSHSITCGCTEDFNPSGSIESAMQVIAEMRKRGCLITMQGHANDQWTVVLNGITSTHEGYYGCWKDQSLETAICHAALMAVSGLAPTPQPARETSQGSNSTAPLAAP